MLAELLIKNPKLKRFCKIEVKESQLYEALYLKQFRWTKSEEERKKKLADDAAKPKDD